MKTIKEEKTNDKNYGYNICEGGKGTKGTSLYGEKNPMFGKHHTEGWRKQQSERMTGNNNPNFKNRMQNIKCDFCGKKFKRRKSDFKNSNGKEKQNHFCSRECQNNKQKETNKGEKNPNYNKGNGVRNKETGEEFANSMRACEAYDVSIQAIRRAIKAGTTCKGFHWEEIKNPQSSNI